MEISGKSWLKGFRARHPKVADRTPERITQASANVSEQNLRKWFKDVESQFQTHEEFENLLLNGSSSQIINMDEISFSMDPIPSKVLAEKGSKNVYITEKGSSKVNITFCFAYQASGVMLPPIVVFKNTNDHATLVKHVPKDWVVGFSATGWMTAELFYKFFKLSIIPSLKKQNIETAGAFMDSHPSHIGLDLLVLAKMSGVDIFYLYPHSTRISQPCDTTIFRPLKQFFFEEKANWELENPDISFDREFLPVVMARACKRITPEVVANGFRSTGLHPWNANAIDYTKCIGKNNPEMSGTRDTTFEALMMEIEQDKLQSSANLVQSMDANRDENNSNDRLILTSHQFRDLIGEEKLLELENGKVSKENALLHKIWRHFFEQGL